MCQQSVDAIKAIGGKAEYIELDEPGWWQGSYSGPFGIDYVGPFRGISHMMMIEDNPAPGKKGKKGKATQPPGHGRDAGVGGQEHQGAQDANCDCDDDHHDTTTTTIRSHR